MSSTTTTPEVLWAQRSSSTDAEKNYVFLTIAAPDVPKIDVDLKPNSLTFTGHSDTKKTTYHVKLELFDAIDVEKSKTIHSSRGVEFVLRKQELKQEYWPRLLKESKKVHFLKTDFDKWVDEDEQEAAPEDEGGLGGMSGMEDMGGMGGMGGMRGMGGGDGGFGGIDFSKLGEMGGAGLGGGEGEDDDDDDEMPGLEDEEPPEKPAAEPLDKSAGKSVPAAADETKHASSATSSKIEEIS